MTSATMAGAKAGDDGMPDDVGETMDRLAEPVTTTHGVLLALMAAGIKLVQLGAVMGIDPATDEELAEVSSAVVDAANALGVAMHDALGVDLPTYEAMLAANQQQAQSVAAA